MPTVRIDLRPMCTREQKQALIENVTEAVVDPDGCPLQVIERILAEVD